MANQAILSDLHGEQRTIALTGIERGRHPGAVMAPLVIGGLAAAGLGLADRPRR